MYGVRGQKSARAWICWTWPGQKFTRLTLRATPLRHGRVSDAYAVKFTNVLVI